MALLAIDLGLFHRKAHEIRTREAIFWSVVWISLAGLFCGWIYFFRENGHKEAIDFATAYIVEKSLSVDNIFVFVVIFSSFNIPPPARHRILYWGVLGAICLRAPLIFIGIELLEHFHPALYFFGALLIFTGVKLIVKDDDEEGGDDVKEGRVVRFARRLFPTTDGFRESRLFVRENGRLLATPLLTTLIIVELSDVMFATDSIPAVLAVVPNNFFVAYTSNIFAILGLRALFFLVSAGIEKFRYLKPALAFILVFVGAKMILGALDDHPFDLPLFKVHVEQDALTVPPFVSLAVIVIALTIAGFFSAWKTRSEERARGDKKDAPSAP